VEPVIVGFVFIGIMLILLFMGVPLAFTFALSGIGGIIAILGLKPALAYLMTVPFSTAASYTFCVMPLFMLMGDFAFNGGITTDAFKSARSWFGHFNGGLAITSTVASGIFGAVCGSGATIALVMTQIAWPEMKKYGYNPRLGLGSIAASGPLAILIPPSVPLIMFGILSETSIGKLFMAGWLPGILLTIVLSVTTLIIVMIDPSKGPGLEKLSVKERFLSLKSTWALLLLILVIIGGIWGGVFTVNEAAGIGVIGSLLIAVSRGKLKFRQIISLVKECTTNGACMFFMFVGIQIFNIFMALSGLPRGLASWVVDLPLPPIGIIWVIIAIYLFLGCFLDSPPVVMLTTGLLAPCVSALGFDLVWFGIVVGFTVALGAITPPVGINLFVTGSRAPDVPSGEIIKGVLPYIAATFVTLILIVHIPIITLLLPNMMIGK
jgi:tripartite ATP-independent transporter DctM subunit